ncbi:MAG: hypothetical protein J6B16_06130 [Clostridia bacterium]|nr:hypothetical protein [Clostridia bacterium]
MSLEYEKPTNLVDLLTVLQQIDGYYKYRKDEYNPMELNKITLTRVNVEVLTDEELLEKARQNLYVKQLKERNDYKMALRDRLIKLNNEKSKYAKIKRDDDQDAYDAYYDAIIKFGSSGANRGLDFASGLTGSVNDLKTVLDNKLSENLTAYNNAIKYIDDEISETLLKIEDSDGAFALQQENEILAEKQELAEKQKVYNNELLRYNNSLNEKETRMNNAVAQAENENMLEYMSIVVNGLTERELTLKGYYKEVMDLIMDYYYAKTDKIAAYEEFCNQSEFIGYLGSYYETMVYLLYIKAYPDKVVE